MRHLPPASDEVHAPHSSAATVAAAAATMSSYLGSVGKSVCRAGRRSPHGRLSACPFARHRRRKRSLGLRRVCGLSMTTLFRTHDAAALVTQPSFRVSRVRGLIGMADER
ncbi:hypothetical protein HER10_EVM0005824 [Colletotrichum scovillei]|uniref:uncharacterized protein n=1 Tax=Colletotrichum scovillei TaxID=1209932 RepID=UPI0015C3B822|nr:uncharacterized protein HER10_EVM0005824 [Colletotrichum scovillei]KAF4783067.1 hypothetical protein HER10_EVM0005824 [Colletotrichum scovillei]